MALSGFSPGKSVSARFLLLCFAISLGCTAPVLWIANHEAEQILLADFTGRLERRRANLEEHFQKGGVPRLRDKIRDRIERGLIDDGMILLIDVEGRRVEGNLARWPVELGNREGWRSINLRKDGEVRADSYLVAVTNLPNGYKLLVSGLLDDYDDVQSALWQALRRAFLLALFLAILGSFLIRRHLDRMVEIVAQTAANIADGNLSQRSPRTFSRDPLDQVSTSLNRILERIEGLIEENRTMTDALAHDLRAPLTRISADLEQALRKSAGSGALARLHAIEQEVARMLRMIDDTLEISRAEVGIGKENFEHVDLAEVVRELYDMYLPLADMQGVTLTLDCETSLPALCNKGLIARSIANLIDNAFNHGIVGKEIALGGRMASGMIAIAVADRGEGIPTERHDEAMGKYRRLSKARARPGMGLGLALVTAIARLHHGKLQLGDNKPGLVACLMIPSL